MKVAGEGWGPHLQRGEDALERVLQLEALVAHGGEALHLLTEQALEGVTVIEADAKPACAVPAAGAGAWVRGMRGRVRGSRAGVAGGRCGWMRGLCSCVCGACAVTWGGVAQAPGLVTAP